MVKKSLTALLLSAAVIGVAGAAQASTVFVAFSGPGVGGSVTLTYGTATDAKYPNAYEVTGISGAFSDANKGLNIVNAPVTGLVPLTHAMPEHGNTLPPADFSRFDVGPGFAFPVLTYDNLFWPGGSPQTATDYPPHGGFLDIYGLLFTISSGEVVNLWSNGVSGSGAADYYGLAVATSTAGLDYVTDGVSAVATTPEPGSFWLLGSALLGMLGLLAVRNGRLTPATLTHALSRGRERVRGPDRNDFRTR